MNPVTGEQFTGKWTPPVKDLSVLLTAENQATTTSVVYAIELKNDDTPDLIVSDVDTNTFGNVIHLDPSQFFLNTVRSSRRTRSTTVAVMATSPSSAAPAAHRRRSPLSTSRWCVDRVHRRLVPRQRRLRLRERHRLRLRHGHRVHDDGARRRRRVLHIAKQTGFHELPAQRRRSDVRRERRRKRLHQQLFLVAQPCSSTAPSRAAASRSIGEDGTFVESINGLNFTDAGSLVLPIRIAINPSTRTGWVNGPQTSQLTQFSTSPAP